MCVPYVTASLKEWRKFEFINSFIFAHKSFHPFVNWFFASFSREDFFISSFSFSFFFSFLIARDIIQDSTRRHSFIHFTHTHIVYIYILNKVCRKYAEGMQCKSLTLSAYLVLQQLSLFQTARAYFTKCIKTLNTFVQHFSRQIVLVWPPPSFGRLSFRQIESFPE